MRTLFVTLLLFLNCALPSGAAVLDHNNEPVTMQQSPRWPGKVEGVTPLDQPDVYFDSDEMALRIYGWDNTLASYHVEVEDYYGVTVASETVAGYGWQTVYLDPVTSSGTATVTIITSRGDEYTGTFYVP